MVIAITGAAARMMNGSSTAMATIARIFVRAMVMSGDDSKTSGSRVKFDMVQIECSSSPATGATTAGNSSAVQNAMPASAAQPMVLASNERMKQKVAKAQSGTSAAL